MGLQRRTRDENSDRFCITDFVGYHRMCDNDINTSDSFYAAKEGKLRTTPIRCPKEGEINVTVLKRASGKILTTCVKEAEVPKLAARGDIVIPAVCPCDASVLDYLELPVCMGHTCTIRDDKIADEVTLRVSCHGISRIERVNYTWQTSAGRCSFDTPEGSSDMSELTLNESKACAAVLWAFAK